VPAVWGALRFGIELEEFPVVKRACEEISGKEAMQRAH
jgi:hypothetical protein